MKSMLIAAGLLGVAIAGIILYAQKAGAAPDAARSLDNARGPLAMG